MSFTISLVHRANIHIAQAIEWCAKQEQDLEIRFLKSLDKSVTYIQKNPLKSQIRYRNVRVKYTKFLVDSPFIAGNCCLSSLE